MSNQLAALRDAARVHADNLRNDLAFTSTRVEMIRITTLALEAEALAASIERLINGDHGEVHGIAPDVAA